MAARARAGEEISEARQIVTVMSEGADALVLIEPTKEREEKMSEKRE